MKQKFRDIRLSAKNITFLNRVNQIISRYQKDGYTLTLRQLYYQLVAADIIPNKQSEYAKLSRVLKEGRLAGVVDWSAIEDRLRQVRRAARWDSPKTILKAARDQFQLDRLVGQDVHLEVWVEKDALSQVVERAAKHYQVPVLVNRGYGSISAIYDTYQRLSRALRDSEESCGKHKAIILYLGDHDPSGLDMVRDIETRVKEMLEYDGFEERLEVEHIALTMDQIKQYNPPPNPAKITDPRAKWYLSNFGATSWEVDALPPDVLNKLIMERIGYYLDLDTYKEILEVEKQQKKRISDFIAKF